MSALRDAASFLTRIPLHRSSTSEPNMSRAVPWFPVVGALLGLIQGGVYLGLIEVATPLVAATVSTALLALITGAFHHDGLADMADAFGGGWTREQRLEILKDSRLGTYGVTTLVFAVLIEVAALASLFDSQALAATVAAHALSRAVASAMMLAAKPAQASGLGVDYLDGLSRLGVLGGSVAAAALTVVILGLPAIAVIAAAYFVGWLVVQLAISKIGGISGDVLGAVQQLTKLTILVGAVIVANA